MYGPQKSDSRRCRYHSDPLSVFDDEEAVRVGAQPSSTASLKLSRIVRPTSEHAMILAKHSTLSFRPLEPIDTGLARWLSFWKDLGTLLVDLACGMQPPKITTGWRCLGTVISQTDSCFLSIKILISWGCVLCIGPCTQRCAPGGWGPYSLSAGLFR